MDESAQKDAHDLQKKYSAPETETKVAHVDERLHSREREGFIPWRERRGLSELDTNVPTDWAPTSLDAPPQKPRSSTLPTLAFLFSLFFMIIAGVGAAYLLSSQPAVQEGVDVTVEVSGNATVLPGDIYELPVVVTNRSDKPLELVDLVVTYPPGTRSVEDGSVPLTEQRLPLGTIAPLSARPGVLRAVLFGKAGDTLTINLSVEYRVAGSSIVYASDAIHKVQMSTGALSASIEGNSETVSGQRTDLKIIVRSHAQTVLKDVVLTVETPFGYTSVTQSPEPTKNALWELGDINPGEERLITLTGNLEGVDGDERVFFVSAGTRADATVSKVETELARAEHHIVVQKPFLSTTLTLDGMDPNAYSFKPGVQTKAEITWKNNLSVPITNASIGVSLGGNAFSPTAVKAIRGFYRSTDNLIVWDKQTRPETFTTIAPGESGKEEFTIAPLSASELALIPSPIIQFALHASGRRTSSTGTPETIQAVAQYTVPVSAQVTFAALGRYLTSPFPKNGPLPPRVDTETIYAIEWSISSSTSQVKDAVVTAELPQNVRYTTIYTPLPENITYNAQTRTVTWFVGTVPKGAGIGTVPPKKVSFAIGFTPSASQINSRPEMVINQKMTGIDSTTKETVTIAEEAVTTTLTEEGFLETYAQVVPVP